MQVRLHDLKIENGKFSAVKNLQMYMYYSTLTKQKFSLEFKFYSVANDKLAKFKFGLLSQLSMRTYIDEFFIKSKFSNF